ncbi:MAG: hypothetical protein LKG20_12380 [Tetrasphaera jenkinsii]|jgi:hypothetical protein|nr:hypothetical protein [Tetrasphaera jenkinsii]
MSVQPRVKPGVPTGGQYAPWGRDESDGLGDIVGTGFDDGQAVSGEDAQIVLALSKAVLDDPNIEAIRCDGESWTRTSDGAWRSPSGEVATSEVLLAGGHAIAPDSDLPIGATERLASGQASGALLQNLDGGWGAMGRSDTLAFTTSEHATFAEAEAALVAWDQNTHPQRWGTTGKLGYGSKTPWGPAQHVSHPAPGITVVSTAGHGGVKLSRERNAMIPAPLRRPGGWYEEDCESYIALMHFPEAAARSGKTSRQSLVNEMTAGVKNWFPDEYEKATGQTIPFGESRLKDEADWYAANADREIAISARMADPGEFTDADGMVAVTVARGGKRGDDAEKRVILVPKDDYDSGQKYSHGAWTGGVFAVPKDATYRDVTPPPKPVVKSARVRTITADFDAMPAATALRIQSELNKRWLDQDGSVRTLRQLVEDGYVNGKTVMVSNGKRNYYIQDAGDPNSAKPDDTLVIPVSKDTWDAIDAPDTREPALLASQAIQVAMWQHEHATTREERERTAARIEALRRATS